MRDAAPFRPTILDVASRAGVSKSTVSRALAGDSHVSEGSLAAVRAAASELDYRANSAARVLRTGRSGTVGLVVGSLRDEVWSAIAEGMDRVLASTGTTLVLASTQGDRDIELDVVGRLIRDGVAGVVLSPRDEGSPVFELARRRQLPVVVIDRDRPRSKADRVLTDHEPAIRGAIRELRANGHARIGLISLPRSIRPGRMAVALFTDLVPDSSDLVAEGYSTEAFGRGAAESLLESGYPPTALLVFGPRTLIGVLEVLKERRLEIPRDLSLVAYDETDVARLHRPAISIVHRDRELIGETAAALMLDRVHRSRDRSRTVLLPATYRARGSVSSASRPKRRRAQAGGHVPRAPTGE